MLKSPCGKFLLIYCVIHVMGAWCVSASHFTLVQPPSGDDFTTLDAGISAYVNVGRDLDLEKAKGLLQGIQAQAEEEGYLIGIISLEGLPETQWPHIYVNKQGLIVAYYPKNEPAVKLFYWAIYDGGKITTTTLEEAIRVFSQDLFREMRLPLTFAQIQPSIRYYDFRYPEATTLLLVADSVAATYDASVDELQYTIPENVAVLEASWLHFTKGLSGGSWSSFLINDTQINRRDGTGNYYKADFLSGDFLIPTLAYTCYVYARDYNSKGLGGIALAFIYFPTQGD